jgi:hypothetical protein
MREEYNAVETAFYAECAAILGATHDYVPWTGRGPNRWNNRRPGNGRFPGFGVVRLYSPNAIHVCLHAPAPLNRMARSPQEALALVRGVVEAQRERPPHAE